MSVIIRIGLLRFVFLGGICPYDQCVIDIAQGFRDDYRSYCHSCDVLFRVFRGASRDVARLLIDALQRSLLMSCLGDLAKEHTYIHPPSSCRPSSLMHSCLSVVSHAWKVLVSSHLNDAHLSTLLLTSPDVFVSFRLSWYECNIRGSLCQVSN